MILSNEPGYYREGAFGIRIENLIVVADAPALEGGDDHRTMLSWQTLTFAPIDRRLIVIDMLDGESRTWLNAYHSQTYGHLAPRVSEETAVWLANATRTI
jgi:Xaa-Pro aminopeptidase